MAVLFCIDIANFPNLIPFNCHSFIFVYKECDDTLSYSSMTDMLHSIRQKHVHIRILFKKFSDQLTFWHWSFTFKF